MQPVEKYQELNRQLTRITGIGDTPAAPTTTTRRKRGSSGTVPKRNAAQNVDIQMRKAFNLAYKAAMKDVNEPWTDKANKAARAAARKAGELAALEAGKKSAAKAGYTDPLPSPVYVDPTGPKDSK